MGGKLWIRQVSSETSVCLYILSLMTNYASFLSRFGHYFSLRSFLFQMLIAAFLLPFLVCGTAFFINFIAMGYHASRAIPFGTMVSKH